jgi:hypothetical protein
MKVAPNIIFYPQKKFHIFLTSLTIFPGFNLFFVHWKKIKQNSEIYILYLIGPDS